MRRDRWRRNDCDGGAVLLQELIEKDDHGVLDISLLHNVAIGMLPWWRYLPRRLSFPLQFNVVTVIHSISDKIITVSLKRRLIQWIPKF